MYQVYVLYTYVLGIGTSYILFYRIPYVYVNPKIRYVKSQGDRANRIMDRIVALAHDYT